LIRTLRHWDMTVVKRLEALVFKLEKSGNTQLAQRVRDQLSDVRQGKLGGLSSLVEQLERSTGDNDSGSSSSSLSEYDSIMSGALETWVTTSSSIGGHLAQQSALVSSLFQAQRQFLATAALSRRPSDANMQVLLKPTAQLISQIQQVREENRSSDQFHHLSAVSESIPALAWVTVSPTPGPHVKEMRDAGMFYTNRVLKEWKEKDGRHVTWVRCWLETLSQLQEFIKRHHTTGLTWSARGGEASLNVSTPTVTKISTKHSPSASSVKSTSAPVKPAKVYGSAAAEGKTPVKRQEGKKWMVEHYRGDNNIVLDTVQLNNSVYIFKCENSAITVKGKCNNVILDSCKKVGVMFDSLVSGVEVTNCQSVQVQCLGSVPIIMVDKTDGCQMFLSKQSLNTEIVSAKCSEVNVMVPSGDEFREMPVPEQFKSVIRGTSVITSPAESV